MSEIGIFGGSFNPVHRGHVALADYIRQNASLSEVWMVVSPLNPLKSGADMAPDADRLAMLRIALDGKEGLRATDVEFSLPRPSYTIDTLRFLSRQYPHHRFRLIVGGDNWEIFDKWKDYREIAQDYCPIVYPRPGHAASGATAELPHVELSEAPRFDVSSTEIREMLRHHDPAAETFLPPGVFDYIKSHNLFTK